MVEVARKPAPQRVERATQLRHVAHGHAGNPHIYPPLTPRFMAWVHDAIKLRRSITPKWSLLSAFQVFFQLIGFFNLRPHNLEFKA